MRRGRTAAALCLLLLVAPCGCRVEGPAERTVAPPFALLALDGREVTLADLAGRTVVIDFWATWCEPCVHQIPVLNAFHRAQAEGGPVVLGIAVDAGGQEAVAPFAAEHGIEYTVLLGTERLAHDFGAPGFPALAVVDAYGLVDSFHLGVITPEDLEAAVAAASR